MSKAVLVIAGIGVAGCLVLSWSMKTLVEHRQARSGVSWRAAVAAAFADELAGELAAHEEHDGARVRVVVHARCRAADRTALANAIAVTAWRHLHGDRRVAEVEVTVRDAAGNGPVTRVAPRPASCP